MKIAMGLLAGLVAAVGFTAGAAADSVTAPFGNQVSGAVTYYNRASPAMGSAGLLGEGGVAEAKALGFKLILDLRAPAEGTAVEAEVAQRVGIPYRNIPVATAAPTADQVAAFAALFEDTANHPILVHCETANRVGAIWALYRSQHGVPPRIALEEGLTLGLHGRREKAVRDMLDLPASGGCTTC